MLTATVYNGDGLEMSGSPMQDFGAINVGFNFVSYVLAFTAIGYGLDRWLHTSPWFIVSGVFVGAVLGFIYMIRTVSAANRKAAEDDDEQDGPRYRSF